MRLYAVCHREEEGWGAGWVWQHGGEVARQPPAAVLWDQTDAHSVVPPTAQGALGHLLLCRGPGVTLAAGLSSLVL